MFKSLDKKKDFFLGDWCLKNFDAFENSDFKVLFGGDKNLKDLNKVRKFVFSYSVYNNILNNLCRSLNTFHKKREKVKYWEFIISTWLWVFIDALQKRWNMVLAVKKKGFDKIITLETKNISLATASSTHLKITSLNSILWNTKLFNEILKFQSVKKLETIKVVRHFENSYIDKKNIKLKYINFNKYNKLNTRFFFYNLAIPKKLRINFLLKNFQIPCFSKVEEKNILLPDEIEIRKKWKEVYKFKKSSNKFLNFLNLMIPQAFPRIYLDKFVEVKNISKKLNWPKKPKNILSSYAHFDDEVFKNFASNLISSKISKYSVMQHGAAGMYKEHVSQFFENKLTDKYFTWGWKNNKNNFPLFVTSNFNKINKIKFKSVKVNILLSIYQFPLFPQRSSYGFTSDFSRNTYYTNYLISFLSGLKKDLIKNTYVKCQILFKPCIQINQIKKRFKKIQFIDLENLKKYHQISKNFQLTIETFLSTGFFESMTLNRPVILLFNKNLTNVNKKFHYWIKKLKKNNICFDNLKDANKFLNNHSKNLERWWFNKNLQKNRVKFCNIYARNPEQYENIFNKKIFNKK